MVNSNFNNLPIAVLGTILDLDPNNIDPLTRVSRGWRKTWTAASQEPSFIVPYFRELITSLGQERLNRLFNRVDWVQSRASLDELTQKVYQYARLTSFGRELLKGIHSIQAASQLAHVVKLIDREEEEDTNLVKIAPRLFDNLDTLYTDIARPEMTEREILSLKAQAIRLAIANMPNRDRDSLNLSHLGLTSIPREIFLFTNLTSLYLDGNKLTTLPAEIGKLVNLETLNLSNNQLTTLPAEIGKLASLSSLYLDDNRITTLPVEFGNLVELKKLHLFNNQITILPAEILNLVKLEELVLVGNQLSTLPAEFGSLVNLKFLYLRNNKFSTLPAQIGSLGKLKKLDLGGNQLSTLPAQIGGLGNLRDLDLRGNQITTLPTEIGSLDKLQHLNLYGNPIETLPAEIEQLSQVTTFEPINI